MKDLSKLKEGMCASYVTCFTLNGRTRVDLHIGRFMGKDEDGKYRFSRMSEPYTPNNDNSGYIYLCVQLFDVVEEKDILNIYKLIQ